MDSLQRFFLIIVAVLTSCVGFPSSAKADEEGRMPLTHIQFDSAGLDNSGPVHIDVSQDQDGISELKVSAFGKLQTVTKPQLAAISGSVFNVVGVSYSRGYTNTGGRNVYVLLYQGVSSGAELAAIVTVKEHGDVRVINKAVRLNAQ